MANPTHQYTLTGGASDANCAMKVTVLKNANASETYRDYAANAIDDACNRLYSDNRIDGWEIEVWHSDWFFLCDEGNLLQQLENYRKDHSSYGFTDKGCYIAVHNCDSTQGAADNNNAWKTDTDAHVTQKNHNSVTDFKHTAIHESLHNFIDESVSGVYYLNGCNTTEHNLGSVNGNNEFTTMSYSSSHVQSGVCNSENSPAGFSTDMTLCTRQSVELTGDYHLAVDCGQSGSPSTGTCF